MFGMIRLYRLPQCLRATPTGTHARNNMDNDFDVATAIIGLFKPTHCFDSDVAMGGDEGGVSVGQRHLGRVQFLPGLKENSLVGK